MKIAQEATGRVRIGKWYQTTMSANEIKFERLLKPFKVGVSGNAGGRFTGFEGGSENA